MSLKAFEEVDAEPLAFPIGGKVYTPPTLGAKAGIQLMRIMAGDTEAAEQSSHHIWQLLLSPAVYAEMVEDDIPMDALARAGFAMLVDAQNDRAAAVKVWESGLDPEVRAALAAAMTTPPSTRPAAATTTPTPASGTGTRTPKKKPAKKASRSAGTRSSRSGR